MIVFHKRPATGGRRITRDKVTFFDMNCVKSSIPCKATDKIDVGQLPRSGGQFVSMIKDEHISVSMKRFNEYAAKCIRKKQERMNSRLEKNMTMAAVYSTKKWTRKMLIDELINTKKDLQRVKESAAVAGSRALREKDKAEAKVAATRTRMLDIIGAAEALAPPLEGPEFREGRDNYAKAHFISKAHYACKHLRILRIMEPIIRSL